MLPSPNQRRVISRYCFWILPSRRNFFYERSWLFQGPDLFGRGQITKHSKVVGMQTATSRGEQIAGEHLEEK